MHPSSALATLLLVALLPSCDGAKSPAASGAALELPFEGSCQPVSKAALAVQAPSSGVTFQAGVEGRAARFDGSGSEVKLKGLDGLAIQDAMTLEFFVKVADWLNPYKAGSGLESLVSHSSIFTVGVDPRSWKLEARLTTDASPEALRLEGGAVPPGAWHHVALVLDPAAGKALLVLDGEVVNEVAARGKVAVRADLE